MVLDTISDGHFEFKNTKTDNARVKLELNDPRVAEDFYFINLKLRSKNENSS